LWFSNWQFCYQCCGQFEARGKVHLFSSVRKCFTAACDYMVHKFPFKHDVLIHAEVVSISSISKASFSSSRFFCQ
jgi:hypothetical protein